MTGLAWDISNAQKPVARFDSDAIRVIPIEIGELLESMGTTYASHQVITALPLECSDQGTHVAGVIPIEMRVAAAAVFVLGSKYPFTIRVVGADGQQDDMTLWLKIVDR